jgi:hypothetical protein
MMRHSAPGFTAPTADLNELGPEGAGNALRRSPRLA